MKRLEGWPSRPPQNLRSLPSCGGAKKPVTIGIPSRTQCETFTRVNPYTGSPNSFLHAEMEALLQSQPGDSLEVLRWRADGTLSMAHPCPFCLALICKKQISHVRYTDWTGAWQTFSPANISAEDLVWWHATYYSQRPRPAGWPHLSGKTP
jgi:hypothetical protein